MQKYTELRNDPVIKAFSGTTPPEFMVQIPILSSSHDFSYIRIQLERQGNESSLAVILIPSLAKLKAAGVVDDLNMNQRITNREWPTEAHCVKYPMSHPFGLLKGVAKEGIVVSNLTVDQLPAHYENHFGYAGLPKETLETMREVFDLAQRGIILKSIERQKSLLAPVGGSFGKRIPTENGKPITGNLNPVWIN